MEKIHFIVMFAGRPGKPPSFVASVRWADTGHAVRSVTFTLNPDRAARFSRSTAIAIGKQYAENRSIGILTTDRTADYAATDEISAYGQTRRAETRAADAAFNALIMDAVRSVPGLETAIRTDPVTRRMFRGFIS